MNVISLSIQKIRTLIIFIGRINFELEEYVLEISEEVEEPISRQQYSLPRKDANTTRIDEYG